MFINKAVARKKIRKAEIEMKRINRLIQYQQERLDTPCEYHLIHKICTKYNLPEDVELYINSFLQKSKMKQVHVPIEYIGSLMNHPDNHWNSSYLLYDEWRYPEFRTLTKGKGGLKKREGQFMSAFSSNRANDRDNRFSYRFPEDFNISNYIHTGYGLRLRTTTRDGYGGCFGCFNIRNECSKDVLQAYLYEYKIPYKERDTRHTLLCKLLGKDPKDPVYTKEIRAKVGRG